MAIIVKNLKMIIYCNFLIALDAEFNFNSTTNTYYKTTPSEMLYETIWMRYYRIEIQFSKDFDKGFYREFYKSNNLKRELCFVSSAKIGEYYADGIERVYYEDLDSNGNETYTILEENKYKKGEKVGIWKTFSIDGGLLIEDYYEDIISSTNGFYGMKQIRYFPPSNKIAEIYERDYGKSFYSSGKLRAKWENKNYSKNGVYSEFHENGSLKMKVTYIDNDRDGQMLKYFENGSLKEEWLYTKGTRIFIKKYYSSGIIKSEWNYKNGELTNKNVFDKNGNLKSSS